MKSRLLPWVGLLVLLFLVLSSWWAVQLRERQRAQNFAQVDPSLPDAWSGRFILLNADVNGRLENFLEGQSMVHYPQKHTWQAKNPVYMHRGDKNSYTFTVVADVGLVVGKWKQEQVYLSGNATLRRFAKGKQPDLWVRSSRFSIDPQQEIVSTEDPVDVIEGKTHLQGVGMVYNNRTGQLKILHDSHVQVQNPEAAPAP